MHREPDGLPGVAERTTTHRAESARRLASAIWASGFAAGSAFAGTSLWVTVQGRVVYIEGCARDDAVATRAEALVRAQPHVQQAIAIVRTDPRRRPPYALRHQK